MKTKYTLLSFFICGLLFAQQPQSYSEVTSQNQTDDTNRQTAIITSTFNGSRSIINTYTTLIDFQDAVILNCSDPTLTSENFDGGPAAITNCGPIINDAGGGCFPAGELESGFNIQGSNGTDTAYVPAEEIGNTDTLIGTWFFVEYTIINFSPGVYAVAMDLWNNNAPTTTVRIFGDGGTLIEELIVTTPINSQTFFGLITDEPISAIEIEGDSNGGELFGNFLFGADCELLSINENILSELSIYPNPSSNIVTINIPSGIEINSILLYDILGNIVLKEESTTQFNISNLSTGLYIVFINTSFGSISKKVFRK